jgi:hypothetical protein
MSLDKKTYKVEDIFTDIKDDPDNVLMTIPPEIIKHLGLKVGDSLNVSVENKSIRLEKIDNALRQT